MIDLSRRWPLGLNRSNWWRLALGVLLVLAGLVGFDRSLSEQARALPPAVLGFFGWITDYGLSDWVLIPSLALTLLTAGLALVIRKWSPHLALFEMAQLYGFIFVGVGLPGLLSNLVKRAIGRGRPDTYEPGSFFDFQHFLNDSTFQSFPSGHTTTSFALAFVVGFLSRRWLVPLLVIAVLVGISRVVVGAHYPTDVVGGIVVGTLGAYLVRNFFADRGWLFRRQPDGSTVLRGFAATRRLVRSRRKAQAK